MRHGNDFRTLLLLSLRSTLLWRVHTNIDTRSVYGWEGPLRPGPRDFKCRICSSVSYGNHTRVCTYTHVYPHILTVCVGSLMSVVSAICPLVPGSWGVEVSTTFTPTRPRTTSFPGPRSSLWGFSLQVVSVPYVSLFVLCKIVVLRFNYSPHLSVKFLLLDNYLQV